MTADSPIADGCGCQYDAAGRMFRTRCICPPPMTPEQTLRAVAGLGGAIGDAVAGVLAELDEARRGEKLADDDAMDWQRIWEETYGENLRLRARIDALLAACDANERHICAHVPHLPADGGSMSVHQIRRILGRES